MYLYQRIKHYSIPEPAKVYSGLQAPIILIYRKLTPEETAFLNKMIIAFKWHTDDIAHVEIDPQEIESYASLWSNNAVKIVWLFDVHPESVGIFIQLPKYHLYRLSSFDMYYTDTLSKIDINKQLKLKVWQDLKDIKIN